MRSLLRCTMALGVVVAMTAPAHALTFDQNVTPDILFGTAVDNGSFTVDQQGGLELGLRAKLRFDDTNQAQNIFNSNGDGTYSFVAGLPPTGFSWEPGSTSTAVWSFEWSINTDFDGSSGLNLDAYDYELAIDFDPSAGTNFMTFDPIHSVNPETGTVQWDHAIGDNSTPNGGGASISNGTSNVAGYNAAITSNNVGQNSWNMEFFDDAGGGFPFNGNARGIYEFVLTAFDKGTTNVAGSTSITVYSTPEPSSMALLGLGIVGLAGARRRQRRRDAAAASDTAAEA
ncbi:PEP-CTERM motif protein [Maioricimonas rarisocia]|uniref:PEP-CTERM motif protein n=1 Tax=Maioricimonas rarisocia TaxID=2528026 RepID=A0A517Z0W2_9PLAN|nr:PEP-CTERM sorting domain-containing protein [Maioricimonas rarisocia]QDU36114.1 PEP-CTERM motif protein [Maioricimonas rarisocia]